MRLFEWRHIIRQEVARELLSLLALEKACCRNV
jgi:hypothetical protein